MKKGYKFVEHTADIMVQARGKDFLEALEQTCAAMLEAIGGNGAKPKEQFEIEEKAQSKKELIVYFLSSVLAEAEIREILPCKIKIEKFEEKTNKIKATIFGEKKRPKDNIKAVTFHELKLEEKKDECNIQVLFDV
ncbi:MAG: archease [Candidatus Micrarchaeia archaeon]